VQAMKQQSIWVFITGVVCVTTSGVTTADGLESSYFCPKYEAAIDFGRESIRKTYGNTFVPIESSDKFSTYTRTGNSLSDVQDCSTATLYCLKEQVRSSDAAFSDVILYAVPKVLTAGTSYAVDGFRFRVERELEFAGTGPGVVVLAEGDSTSGIHMRYKLYVEERKGIRHMFFEKLRGFSPGSDHAVREYVDVTCTLMSAKGLFPKVRVLRSKAPEVIDY